jgi:amino acid adenylation domain-containing protein
MAESTPIPCVHGAFREQVGRAPGALAVVCGEDQLTYAELDGRANQLARHLQTQGVGPEVLVGICLARSVDMVVGLLAVLKAGGAYLPLDPAFPPERLALILDDARPAVLVAHEDLLAVLPPQDARVVCLDGDRDTLDRQSAEEVIPAAGPNNLAYVLYTSGSTGKPKGVEVPRGALANFLTSMRDQPGLTESDRVLAVTTLSFDIAGLELWLPLVVGAVVDVATREMAADGAQLAERLATTGTTVLQATPATWRLLLSAGWQGTPGLKILCGGEALPRSLANELLRRGASVWNLYGPTETTIWSTLHRVKTTDGPVSIGRPIRNTQVHLLDTKGQRVPEGEAGELCIGGDGLARGYRNRPDLTAERFIPDAFGGEPGARLYRTGDLARWLPDGTLECLGRIDHQVKIRGFRIELGDVEAALQQHPAVREAVAVAREDVPGDKRLVAYFIARSPSAPAVGELRKFLREKLPDYMVPSAFVAVERWPLTPNRKVDRLALPAPDPGQVQRDRPCVPPRDAVERDLVAIWEKALNVRPVGVRDNVFDLGVHSLTAAQIFADTGKKFGKKLPPGLLFQAPTVEAVAQFLRGGAEPPRHSSLVPIQPHGSRPPLFCVHGGAGTVLMFHDLARHLGDDQPLYGLQMRGLYGGAPPHTRVEDMAAHYLQEIRAVQPRGPYRLGGYCFGGLVAYEMAQRLLRQGESVALLALFNAPCSSYLRKLGRTPVAAAAPARAATGTARQELRRDRQETRLAHAARLVRRVASHAGFRCRQAVRGLNPLLRKVRWKMRLALGLPLPESLRDGFFLGSNARAEVAYEAKPYSGPMVLFMAKGYYRVVDGEPQLGWARWVAGGLETYEIPGTFVTQRTLMSDPYAAEVADLLRPKLTQPAPRAAAALAGAHP